MLGRKGMKWLEKWGERNEIWNNKGVEWRENSVMAYAG